MSIASFLLPRASDELWCYWSACTKCIAVITSCTRYSLLSSRSEMWETELHWLEDSLWGMTSVFRNMSSTPVFRTRHASWTESAMFWRRTVCCSQKWLKKITQSLGFLRSVCLPKCPYNTELFEKTGVMSFAPACTVLRGWRREPPWLISGNGQLCHQLAFYKPDFRNLTLFETLWPWNT